jgi:hypothetical protein
MSVFAGSEAFSRGVLTATEISGTYADFVGLPTISRFDAEVSSAKVSTVLLVPLGAVVTRAVVHLTASAPGTTSLGGIATVRASAGEPDARSNQLVVDFGSLRTVSAVAAPTSISKVTPWAGTKFDGTITLTPSSGKAVTFTELQTERLLIDLGTGQLPSAVATDGLVTSTTPPADLELTVGDGRFWSRAGPAPAGFAEDVDVTAAVQGVVDAATAGDAHGNVAVRVTLAARVPGKLGLTMLEEPRFLRTHMVSFPSATTTVIFDEEGVADLALPLPSEAQGWTIHRVIVTAVPSDPGPERVLPPDQPAISAEAELTLDSDRRLVARLPSAPLGRFERLAGVRILLSPQAEGIEVGGALLTGTADAPTEPVAGAGLTPVSLNAGPQAWVTLRLPRAIDLAKVRQPAPDDHLWVSIAVTRGAARLALANLAGMAEPDRALLRRVAPNGISHPLSTALRERLRASDPPEPIAADTAALRVIGTAPVAAPVSVVEAEVAGGGTVREPGPAGSVAITLDPVGKRSPLQLRFTATAAHQVTVGPVVVAYTDPSQP